MFNLLYKELRLAAHPTFYVFTLLGALVLVPSYPYGAVFLFGSLAPYITAMYGRETNDIYYTVLLPVKRCDVVVGKCLMVAVMQIAQLLVSLPFAFLRVYLLPQGNPVGIEANVAYYGFGLLLYAVFDFIFITQFFATAYKAGRAFILASVPLILGITAMEIIVHLPAFYWLDSTAPADLLRQLPILLVGGTLYGLALPSACYVAKKRFQQVDL